jgi:hypothetical protein
MTKDEIVDTLNDLIQITEDSHEGYRKSAEDAKDADLKSLFNDLSAQRGAMVRDLQKHVAEQGGAPEASGTVLGGAHRFFVDLKSAVTAKQSCARSSAAKARRCAVSNRLSTRTCRPIWQAWSASICHVSGPTVTGSRRSRKHRRKLIRCGAARSNHVVAPQHLRCFSRVCM